MTGKLDVILVFSWAGPMLNWITIRNQVGCVSSLPNIVQERVSPLLCREFDAAILPVLCEQICPGVRSVKISCSSAVRPASPFQPGPWALKNRPWQAIYIFMQCT